MQPKIVYDTTSEEETQILVSVHPFSGAIPSQFRHAERQLSEYQPQTN